MATGIITLVKPQRPGMSFYWTISILENIGSRLDPLYTDRQVGVRLRCNWQLTMKVPSRSIAPYVPPVHHVPQPLYDPEADLVPVKGEGDGLHCDITPKLSPAIPYHFPPNVL
jgi:hypothetical protein